MAIAGFRAYQERANGRQSIKELEGRRLAAQVNITECTEANAGLLVALKSDEASAQRARRTARQDGSTVREEISALQQRRL